MKKFMILLLTLCNITPALAEDIKNIDTPVNWSYTAIYQTAKKYLERDCSLSPEVAHDLAGIAVHYYIDDNSAKSPKWICDRFRTTISGYTDNVNCSEFIEDLVKYHNMHIDYNKAPDRINTSTPDVRFFWLQSAIYAGCEDYEKKTRFLPNNEENYKKDCLEVMSQAFNYNFMFEARSINELHDFCKEELATYYEDYLEFDGTHYYEMQLFNTDKPCTEIINKAIEYQNRYADEIALQNSGKRLWGTDPVP